MIPEDIFTKEFYEANLDLQQDLEEEFSKEPASQLVSRGSLGELRYLYADSIGGQHDDDLSGFSSVARAAVFRHQVRQLEPHWGTGDPQAAPPAIVALHQRADRVGADESR